MGPTAPFTCCAAFATTLEMAGVGVSLCGQPMYASTPSVERVEDRQFVLGEGPMIDAFQHHVVVEAPDVSDQRAQRWLHLDLAAESIGAAFAFPLLVSDACLGAVTMYRAELGPLSDVQRVLLHLVADATALETADLLVEGERSATATRRSLDSTTCTNVGIVMAQLHIGAAEATIRLRAHAFQSDRPADHVVRQLRSHALALTDDRIPCAPPNT